MKKLAKSKTEKRCKVVEIPIGKYDAVRTLRRVLALAEKGEIDDVIIICQQDESEDGEIASELWVTWSDTVRMNVLWIARWFNSFINDRYFGQYHR